MPRGRSRIESEAQAEVDRLTPVLQDGLLTRAEILEAEDIIHEVVEVPEWGGRVKVKALSGTERDSFESSMLVGSGRNQKIVTENIRAKLVALTIVDANNQPMFTMQDIAVLGRKSAAALDRVYEVAARLSKISAGDVEELAGNSGNGRSTTS